MAKKIEKVDHEAMFTKEQLIQSARFSDRKDLLNAILDDKKSYSITEVTEKIDKFMKGKVN